MFFFLLSSPFQLNIAFDLMILLKLRHWNHKMKCPYVFNLLDVFQLIKTLVFAYIWEIGLTNWEKTIEMLDSCIAVKPQNHIHWTMCIMRMRAFQIIFVIITSNALFFDMFHICISQTEFTQSVSSIDIELLPVRLPIGIWGYHNIYCSKIYYIYTSLLYNEMNYCFYW